MRPRSYFLSFFVFQKHLTSAPPLSRADESPVKRRLIDRIAAVDQMISDWLTCEEQLVPLETRLFDARQTHEQLLRRGMNTISECELLKKGIEACVCCMLLFYFFTTVTFSF